MKFGVNYNRALLGFIAGCDSSRSSFWKVTTTETPVSKRYLTHHVQEANRD
jgi:hypothetical protein